MEAVAEVEAAVEEADGAVVAADHHLPSAAGAALDLAAYFLGNRALSRQFLLEELEFPPLVHRGGLGSSSRSDGSGFAGRRSAAAKLTTWR